MRVLVLTPAYPPFPGGGERYVRALVSHLVRQGVTITVVTSQAQTEQDFWRGQGSHVMHQKDGPVELVRVPLRPFPGGRSALMGLRKAMVLLSLLPGDQSSLLQAIARATPRMPALRSTLDQLPDSFDLIHGFNISWDHALVAGWRFAQRQQRPFLVTPFMHFGAGRDRIAMQATMDHQRRLLLRAESVLTLTEIEKAGLRELGVAPERLVVIGGGNDPPPAVGDVSALHQRYRLSVPYALFVGRASRDKGAFHAVQAVQRLRNQGTEVSLALIGQTTPEFERFYTRLKATEQQWIRPLGRLSENEKHTLLAASAMLLLPSRVDSFGLVILEAWGHGIPVIAAEAGGLPGVVEHLKTGLLTPYGDPIRLAEAIQRLLSDPSLGHRLGQEGQARLRTDYTWPRVADRVTRIYQETLMKPGG